MNICLLKWPDYNKDMLWNNSSCSQGIWDLWRALFKMLRNLWIWQLSRTQPGIHLDPVTVIFPSVFPFSLFLRVAGPESLRHCSTHENSRVCPPNTAKSVAASYCTCNWHRGETKIILHQRTHPGSHKVNGQGKYEREADESTPLCLFSFLGECHWCNDLLMTKNNNQPRITCA